MAFSLSSPGFLFALPFPRRDWRFLLDTPVVGIHERLCLFMLAFIDQAQDALLKAIVEDNCTIQLCFLDPNGTRCAEREEEENYPTKILADLTSVNILVVKTLYNQIARTSPEHLKNLEIRTYNLTPRFNIYIVDDALMTVQSYAYGRGEDTPTLLLQRKTRGGLFDFYADAAKYVLEHSVAVCCT